MVQWNPQGKGTLMAEVEQFYLFAPYGDAGVYTAVSVEGDQARVSFPESASDRMRSGFNRSVQRKFADPSRAHQGIVGRTVGNPTSFVSSVHTFPNAEAAAEDASLVLGPPMTLAHYNALRSTCDPLGCPESLALQVKAL